MAPKNFSTNIFINCPFDKDYKSLLRPILFTIVYLGFNPRLASERSDSLEQRIEKILNSLSLASTAFMICHESKQKKQMIFSD